MQKAVVCIWNSFVKITAHLLLCFLVMIICTTKNFPLFIFISIEFDTFDDNHSNSCMDDINLMKKYANVVPQNKCYDYHIHSLSEPSPAPSDFYRNVYIINSI